MVGVYSTQGAYAALKSDGTVVVWGPRDYGGSPSSVANSSIATVLFPTGLTDVVQVFASQFAFAALKSDGSLVTWGYASRGGDSSSVAADLQQGIVAVYGNLVGFAALKSDGRVVSWGEGGVVSATTYAGVRVIERTEYAFAAVRNDGTVATWGIPSGGTNKGADSSSVQASLTNVQKVYSTNGAFAALRQDGTVVAWGASAEGGSFTFAKATSVAPLLTNVRAIYSTNSSFAALRDDGTVVTWGGTTFDGGNSDAVQSQLSNVTSIHATNGTFAALRSDGQVVVWGKTGTFGADTGFPVPESVQAQLFDVINLFSSTNSFAAVKRDRTVVAWGANVENFSTVQSSALDTQHIYTSGLAFAALRSETPVTGTAVSAAAITATVSYDAYTDFSPTGVELSGSDGQPVQGATVSPSLTGASEYLTGFLISGLTPETSYDALTFRLTRGVTAASVASTVSFVTTAPGAVQNVAVDASHGEAVVTYDEYVDVGDVADIVLFGGLQGLSYSPRAGTSNYRSGFALAGLAANTLYEGSFVVASSAGVQSPAFDLTFTTSFMPPQTVVVTASPSGALVSYDAYGDFIPVAVQLQGDIAEGSVTLKSGTDTFSSGFVISGLRGQTPYAGLFKLSGTLNGLAVQSSSAGVSFTTTSIPPVGTVSITPTLTSLVVSYPEYTAFFPSQVILSSIPGGVVSLLQGASNFVTGFVVNGLVQGTLYAGTFVLKQNLSESPPVPLNFSTTTQGNTPFVRTALGASITRTDGSVYIQGTQPIVVNTTLIPLVTLETAHAQLQSWFDQALDVSENTMEDPFFPSPLTGQTMSLYTVEDAMYVHDRTIDFASMTTSSSQFLVYISLLLT